MEISVVVSTRNRADALPSLFEALGNQTISGRIPWELVIVDNGSGDATNAAFRELASRADFPVAAIFEGRRGKSHGLNAGLAAARGRIVALTDDDGIPAADWLERILEHFAGHPSSGCLGGRVELYDRADAPISIRTSTTPSITGAATFSPDNIPVIGCNMAITAAAFRAVGLYDPDIGPGSRCGVAEDVDMLYRLVSSGFDIHYDPRVLVRHHHGRRTQAEIKRVERGYVTGRCAFYCKYILRGDGRMGRAARAEADGLVREWIAAGVVTRRALGSLSVLRLLTVGAIRYWRHRERHR